MKNLLLSIVSFFILVGSAFADPATVIYFTAGTVPTVSEAADIALLQTGGAQKLKVLVRNSTLDTGLEVSKADYVASVDGSTNIPTEYNAVDVIDQDSLLIVENGDTVAVTNSADSISKNATAVVANEALTEVTLAATDTMVSHSGSATIKNSAESKTVTGTRTVAAGVESKILLAATEAIVSDTNSVTVNNSADGITKTGTATVAAGVISKVNLASTVTILTHTTAIPAITITGDCTTGTSTFTPTVVAGVLTGGACSD